MMKNFILIFVFFPIYHVVAQIPKGTIFITPGLNIEHRTRIEERARTGTFDWYSSQRMRSWGLEGGYSVLKNIVIGFNVGGVLHKSEVYSGDRSQNFNYSRKVVSGLSLKYFRSIGKQTGFMIGASYMHTKKIMINRANFNGHPDPVNGNEHYFSIKPAFYWFICPKLLLIEYLGDFYYMDDFSVSESNNYRSKRNELDLHFSPGVINWSVAFLLNNDAISKEPLVKDVLKRNFITGSAAIDLQRKGVITKCYLYFQPTYGRFISRNLAAGVSMGVNKLIFTLDHDQLIQSASAVDMDLSISPFLRVYHFTGSSTSIFMHGAVERTIKYRGERKNEIRSVSLQGGINQKLSNDLVLELITDLFRLTDESIDGLNSGTETIRLKFDHRFLFGLSYFF